MINLKWKVLFRAGVFGVLSLHALYAGEDLSIETWTRESDKVTISAQLVSYDHETKTVNLKLTNGKEAEIDAGVLIMEHQVRLEEYSKALLAKEEASSKSIFETVQDESFNGHAVHVYKPAGYLEGDSTSASRPIAFLYSPGGKSKSIVDRLKLTSDTLGWVLVGVDAYRNAKGKGFSYEDKMASTKAAYKWAEENLTFDPSKVVFGGMSGGAWWAYQSSAEVNDKAAAVLAFGGWMSNMYEQKYAKKMAVAIVNGDSDKGAKAYEEKDGDFLKRKASATLKVIHFPGGHVLAPADVALKAAQWIHEEKEF